MLIKQHDQYQLEAALSPYRDQYSLTLRQLWPQALNPHWRSILQVSLTKEELRIFGEFLIEASRGECP